MYEGLVAAKKELGDGLDFSYSEKILPADARYVVPQYAAQGYDIIIGHGAQFKNLVMEMAAKYPDITFAFGAGTEVGPSNVFTYMAESEETGYLSGLIAGIITKTGRVGLVGSVDGGDAARYNRGFVLGVQAVNRKAKIDIRHTGSSSDFVKAGEVARSQIAGGADVLTGSSPQVIGALRTVAEAKYRSQNIWWLGQDLAQLGTEEGKARCIAASGYNYGTVILGMVNKVNAGVKGGEYIPLNFSNKGLVFEFNPALRAQVTPEIRAKVAAALATLRASAGTIGWMAVDYSKL